MLRISARLGGVWLAVALMLMATPASAQVVQSLHIGVGAFFPRGGDGRTTGDVLVADQAPPDPLAFKISDFRTASIFGEWTVAFSPRVEFAGGLAYYRKQVPSVYRDLVNDNGSEIAQTLRLRVIPLTGVVRFLPFGTPTTFQPYVGAGVGVLTWRYSEIGQFVEGDGVTIFDNTTKPFVATGRTAGPILLGGFRAPVGGDVYAITLEYRYQFGTGNTGGLDKGFLGDKIDLGGGHLNFGFLIRF
jgi:hypothetical protein